MIIEHLIQYLIFTGKTSFKTMQRFCNNYKINSFSIKRYQKKHKLRRLTYFYSLLTIF